MHSQYNTLEELLNATEGQASVSVQFKEAKRSFEFTQAAKICCALSNCGGGKLVLGITDKRPRQAVGSQAFPQPERTREGLISKLNITIDFQLYDAGGNRVLVFHVAGRPVGMTVQYEGIPWYYIGDSLVPMPEEKRRAIYTEGERDFSACICPGASVADLDPVALSIFRQKWYDKRGETRIKNANDEQLMHDCQAMTDEGLTYAGLILFGTRKSLNKYLAQAEIVFEYRSGESAGPAQQRVEIREGLFVCFDKIWELVNLRNDRQHYQEGFFVYDIPTFNERVVREAVLNAVSHRNYQLAGSVFLRQYRDRLQVESPGGLPVGITLSNILDRQSPRNRRIAEILALCGLVDRSGQGMNLMYEQSIIEAKALPDFQGTDDYFVRIVLHGMVLDKGMLALIKKIGEERLETLYTDDLLAISNLFQGKTLSQKQKARLRRLLELGIVEQASRGKYILSRGLYAAAGKPGTYTRKKGLDRETNKELLLTHLRSTRGEGAPLGELMSVLPSHSASQLQVLLRELRNEGKIHLVGMTRGARWYISAEEK